MAKEKRPAMPLYVRDILADEHYQLMSLAERGAYMTLLLFCWQEGSIPDDPGMAARLCDCNQVDMEAVWLAIRPRFRKARTGQRLIHKRIECIRSAAEVEHKRRVNYGKIGAHKRWSSNNIDSKAIAEANPLAIQKPCLAFAFASASSKEKEKGDYDPVPGWDKFMEEYPGELIPDRDCRVWMSVVTSAKDEAILWRNLVAWKTSRKWQEGFAPAAKNFLFDGHWKVPPREPPARKSRLDKIMEGI